ncbi:hypothetical protein Tco_0606405 [Tanacetum coccineum]
MPISSSSSSSSDEDDDEFDMMMFLFLKENTKAFIDRIPCRTSMLSGKEYVREILCGNPIQCYESFRMKPHVFLNLCDKLKMMELLQDTSDVSVEEAWAPTSKQKSFRGRKAVLVTQNVMAICSHDMMFTFVYTGWEGTANDSRVFPLPKGGKISYQFIYEGII